MPLCALPPVTDTLVLVSDVAFISVCVLYLEKHCSLDPLFARLFPFTPR